MPKMRKKEHGGLGGVAILPAIDTTLAEALLQCPYDKEEGDTYTADGPHGPIEVTVPPHVHHRQIFKARLKIWEIELPEDYEDGDDVYVEDADGTTKTIPYIPSGNAIPGEVVKVQEVLECLKREKIAHDAEHAHCKSLRARPYIYHHPSLFVRQ